MLKLHEKFSKVFLLKSISHLFPQILQPQFSGTESGENKVNEFNIQPEKPKNLRNFLWTWVEIFHFFLSKTTKTYLLSGMRVCLCVDSSEKKATDYKSQKALGQKTTSAAHDGKAHKRRKLFFPSKFSPFMSCQTIVVCLANSTIIYFHQLKLKSGLLLRRSLEMITCTSGMRFCFGGKQPFSSCFLLIKMQKLKEEKTQTIISFLM